MQRMQMIQPELTKLQEKYAGKSDQYSQARQAQEMQALYQKYNINPFTSMIMPFVQLPILICMYYAVQRADAVVSGTVLGQSLSTTPKEAFANGQYLFFGIFVLMAVSQFVSSGISRWLAKKSREKDHKVKKYAQDTSQQDSTNNIMMITMLVMIVALGFRWPMAMSLYWLINSVINTAKTIFIQRRYVDGKNWG